MIFIAVGTPTKMSGFGAGKACNLRYVELCVREIKKQTKKGVKIIVEKSTVPVKTCEEVKKILGENTEEMTWHVVSNPEFLAEGTGVRDLVSPSRVLIGGDDEFATNTLKNLYMNWVPEEKIITTNLFSSELTKLVSNTMLAQRISSINGISALCEKTGADIMELSKAVGADPRIGPKFLLPSVGFGGSCFQKDILNLCYLLEQFGLHEVAEYFHGIIKINNFQRRRFSLKVLENLFQTVNNKNITIFGFTFKQNTSDTRESSSIYVSRFLLKERANVRIWDPKVEEKQVYQDLHQIMDGSYHVDPMKLRYDPKVTKEIVNTHVKVFKDPYEAAKDSHAILILTEWKEFKDYDYEKIFKSMKKPAWVFDGRILLDHQKLKDIGFHVYCLGKKMKPTKFC